MRHICMTTFAATLLSAGILLPAPVGAQNKPQGAPAQTRPAPAMPYKTLAITPARPMQDAGLDALRKQIGEAAKKKDRAALARLVAGQGFFWDGQEGKGADKKKSGGDNLTAIMGLNRKDGAGWDMLAGMAADPTVSESADHKGAVCAPAEPGFNDKEFDDLIAATQTDLLDWGYTLVNGAEVRATPQTGAAVVEKLGLHLVRVMPDNNPAAAVAAYIRVVTPAGKTGYVAADAIAPLGSDQLCFVKEAGGWKIGGYIGDGDAQ